MMDVPVVTDRRRGAIGVDLNADHSGGRGNRCLGKLPRTLGGCHWSPMARALIRLRLSSAMRLPASWRTPVMPANPSSSRRLDFRQKKAVLEGESRRYSRMLSSFSYGKVKAYFISRGYRQGVEIHRVNPAFSSVIGRVKFMERYGLSVHQAAALVLARRLLGCSERIPRLRVAPVGNGVHVAFLVPARKRVKHVWTYWGAISGQLRPALAAQYRLDRRRRRSNPAQAGPQVQACGVA